MPGDWATDAHRRARLDREARVLASINHPNIAMLHGVVESPTGPVLVMELVEGTTLADRLALGGLRARSPMRWRSRGRWRRRSRPRTSAASSIATSSRRTSSSAPDGTPKVLDFGLAKASRDRGGADRRTRR